jgi:hypothetical protein
VYTFLSPLFLPRQSLTTRVLSEGFYLFPVNYSRRLHAGRFPTPEHEVCLHQRLHQRLQTKQKEAQRQARDPEGEKETYLSDSAIPFSEEYGVFSHPLSNSELAKSVEVSNTPFQLVRKGS